MIIVALTLGLMGSLHCIGMCGPLAIAFGGGQAQNKYTALYKGFSYNIGRAVTYAFLGFIFGGLGSLIAFSQAQKTLSIIAGIILIIAFFASIDLEYHIRNFPVVNSWYNTVQKLIGRMMKKSQSYPAFVLGLANGLLPCGLVYLALAGALTSGSLLNGMFFMFVFGLGTIPILLVLSVGSGMIPMSIRKIFRKALPYVMLSFGIFLCYRGIAVDLPAEINFWEAVRNPVMCH